MAGNAENGIERHGRRWRIAAWGTAALLLLLPLVATALAQALVAVIALVAGMGHILVATAFFGALWLASAWLFRRATLEPAAAGAVP